MSDTIQAPAICTNCKKLFKSSIYIGGLNHNLSGNTQSCPFCHSTAKILDGSYSLDDSLDDPVLIIRNLNQAQLKELLQFIESNPSEKMIEDAIKATSDPVRKSVLRWVNRNKGFLVAIADFIRGLIQG